MTMFNKVFGSQMAASQDTDTQSSEGTLPAPNDDPLLVPTAVVLTTREQEIAERRAESAAERLWRDRPVAPNEATLPAPISTTPPTAIATPRQPEPAQPVPAQQVARPAGNARTRLLGFGAPEELAPNPMAGPVATPQKQQFPTGWIVIVDGPGRGHSFPLFSGVSTVGRDATQAVALCFGDMAISREQHASIAYDTEDNSFYVGHGSKSNIVRLNGRPLLSTEPLTHGDTLRVGETVLRFAAFCGPDFDWAAKTDD